ncbi:V-type ATPase 116kDa subunit family protein [Demequina sp. SYSU T00039]|uniref:V-type ATPase 116kDa subunit family protein n=1 Tax=Demequina lignilytica TaxID=3051663 RepID=A0AAW7M994_9MICO|nr:MULTISPECIES: V-type ATPase 116kDa subunit family protein [unclassified Demequina]MDN4477523.1 V-type ATPase 116kDa subunit family protein [Demequina sp. SYSU T00039-1]MDN4488126.1 V-type ATPase 116kDa subunit family protein [Demequina sp. SYSU T00039]MDN4490567.1 V-type ATPase 116kDa subunit family protein [Demequina sp. SYSU T00068]
MDRVAIVALEEDRDRTLAAVARAGIVELDLRAAGPEDGDPFARAARAAVTHDRIVGWVGWMPSHERDGLASALAPLGAAVVPLRHPAGEQPPTLMAERDAGTSRTLVDTYGVVPYADVDPARLAAAAYILMFGMMFGDVGHGAMLAGLGLAMRAGWIPRLRKLTRMWLFVTLAGLAAMVFGALYGEAFGPTGLVPVLWLDPMDDPVPLLLAAVGIGGVLLAGSYATGTINRVREGGWGYALYARSGLAGAGLLVALALLTWGLVADVPALTAAGAVLALAALVLIFIGVLSESGGGATGVLQAGIESVDAVSRLGSNVVSFARLAAFGLTHAALLTVIWDGTTALWRPGWAAVAAVLVFVVGNVITFGLEALVAGVQALRLEYYELFSRVFVGEGRAFRPWHPEVPEVAEPSGAAASEPDREE